MFIGHAAVAFAAKNMAPRVSLGVLLAAATWLDLVWPVLVLLGIEQVRVAPAKRPSRRSPSSPIRGRTAR